MLQLQYLLPPVIAVCSAALSKMLRPAAPAAKQLACLSAKTAAISLREPLHIFDLPDSSEIIEAALATVKLSPALLDRYPHQVSGGEVQRLSIARALLLKPKLLILDEPTSMLDISVQAQILQLLKNIRRQEQMAFLFISHDKAVINYMCDRQLYMQEGSIT